MATKKIQDNAPPTTTPPGTTSQSTADAIAAIAALAGQTTSKAVDYQPGSRLIVENGKWKVYTGEGLVTSDGKVASRDGQPYYYDVDNEPGVIWSSLTPVSRNNLMEKLATAGFMSPNSIGDYSSEMTAISQWLQASNYAGLEKSNFLSSRLAGESILNRGGGGSAPTYRVSNPDELKLIAKKVSQETLGRELNDDDVDRFVKAYQAQEIAGQKQPSGGVVTQTMGADVAAQQFAQESAPTEAAAYEYLGYVNKFVDSIGSL
jgi:hypothetical protein